MQKQNSFDTSYSPNTISKVSLLLSSLRGLLGYVSPNLRGIFISRNADKTETYLNFYYDEPFSDDEYEMASLTHTEVMTDFIDEGEINFRVITYSTPQKLPLDNLCLYLRYGELGKVESYKPLMQEFGFVETQTPFVFSRLAIIKAMWGKITPNIREIIVTENGLTIYFVFENQPTSDELKLSEMIYHDYSAYLQTALPIEKIIKTLSSEKPLLKIHYSAYVRYPELGEI